MSFNCAQAFESLEKRTRIQLEHPLLTELHTTLVRRGDYPATEKLILSSLQQGFFTAYMR
jgi:hypothetical protein